MSYFDLGEERFGAGHGAGHGGGHGAAPVARLAEAFAGVTARFCIISFDTDWLYPTSESRKMAHALNAVGAPVSFMELAAPFGHDSFLLDVPALDRVITGFLSR
jgi:homoserine O-acetyltransferase